MFKLFTFVTVAAAAFGVPVPKERVDILNGRIVGGKDAAIEEYSYQGVLLYNNVLICGAAIISPTFVVTAGQCTVNFRIKDLTVRVGSSRAASGGLVFDVANVYIHPRYNDYTLDYDVSVIELKSAIEFNASAGPIQIAQFEVDAGEIATITGYGDLEANGDLPDVLQVAEVPIVDLNLCRRLLGDSIVRDTLLCAGFTDGGVDACRGDRGGPLVVNGTLAGLVSWGFGCARSNSPRMYTKVSAVANCNRGGWFTGYGHIDPRVFSLLNNPGHLVYPGVVAATSRVI